MPLAAIPILAFLLQPPSRDVTIHTHNYIPPPAATLSAETNLVETTLVVRDYQGKPIGGFHASDFQLLDNNKPQQILSFSESGTEEPAAATAAKPGAEKTKPTPPSRFVTLFFDDLHTEPPELVRAVAAARSFLASQKRTGQIAVVTSSGTADLDFTTDAATLQTALDRVHSHTRPPVASCPALTPVDAWILLRNLDNDIKTQATQDAATCICGPSSDASCLKSQATTLAAPNLVNNAAEAVWSHAEIQSTNALAALVGAGRHLAGSMGSRTLVMISSGFLPPLQTQMETVVNAALRANITVHALDAKGLNADREGVSSGGLETTRTDRAKQARQNALWSSIEKLTRGTGGHLFRNTNDLASALEMAAEPAVSYSVSFNPGARDGQFHTLKIGFKTKSPYSLQFRPGYFSPPDLKKEPLNRARLDAAVFSNEILNALRADVMCVPSSATVNVTITLDLSNIEFKPVRDRRDQQIVFLMTLLDPSGSFVTGKESVMDLTLTPDRLASLQKSGLKAVATLNAPSGTYQVRTIVREAMKGDLAATTTPIQIPQ
jgi:VWFA-related protein